MADDDFSGRGDSIGETEAMRNEEQKLRDNQGGSELTNRPDDHPVGAPGETASAEADGAPPSSISVPSVEPPARRATNNIGAPVQSSGPTETTLPEQSPLAGAFQPGGPSSAEEGARGDARRRHAADVPPGHIPTPEERGE